MSDEIVWLGNPPEPCRKVREFSELTPGVIIYLRDCHLCGRDWCRAIVFGPSVERCDSGCQAIEMPACDDTPGNACMCAYTVRAGDVYRVVDARMEQEGQQREATKPRQRQKEAVDR